VKQRKLAQLFQNPNFFKIEGKTNRVVPKIWENEAERSEPFKNFTRSKQNERLRSYLSKRGKTKKRI
jgi:hypothetical protein